MRTKKIRQGLQSRTSALAVSAMILEMDRKRLQYLFLDVIDKFNLSGVLLSYRNSNNATEGCCTAELPWQQSSQS